MKVESHGSRCGAGGLTPGRRTSRMVRGMLMADKWRGVSKARDFRQSVSAAKVSAEARMKFHSSQV
jgi:hypothetical protein